MSKPKFTPGPWHVDYRRGWRVWSDDGMLVASCDHADFDEANACLIAAAPELYAALAGILEIGKRDMTNSKYDGYFDEARSVLKNARGE